MTRSEKLNAALEILDFKLNSKISSLVELMQYKIENEQKLQDLMNYQENYYSTNNNKQSQTIANIQINHNLMTKLEEAIEIQQKVVQDLDNKVKQMIVLLQKDRAQNSALGILVKRYHQQEKEVRQRSDQKELDSQIISMLQNNTRK